MIKVVTHVHLETIWYYSEPSDIPYSLNQFLGWDFFGCFLQQDSSNIATALMPQMQDLFNLTAFLRTKKLRSSSEFFCQFSPFILEKVSSVPHGIRRQSFSISP